MNIKHYLSAMAALAMLAACSDYDPGMSENAVDLTDAEIETIQEYTANFVERYGEMDPNHTWGFGELAEMEEMGTRASEPRSNEWVKVITGKGQKKNDKGEPLYNYNGTETTEPGHWENWNDGNDPHWVAHQEVPLYNGDVPIAFEKHTGAVAIPGFPVQNYYLSSNYKTSETVQYEGTQFPENKQGWYHFRFANSNKEEWFPSEESILQYMRDNNINDGIIPLGDVASCNTLTDAEVADVYAEFSKEWKGTNPAIDLKSYFVQQVWEGKEQYSYTNQDGSTGTMTAGKDNMDYLVAYGTDYTAGDTEHFYNFNGSNFSSGNGGMMLIYDSNTKNFAYHNSWMEENNTSNPTAATMWDHFRLVELHGNYYVGFDFESIGEYNKNIPRDHIYNDWIVKIIPGEGTINEPDERTRTIKRRVMCEDLGSTFDFDFNDLVFDVEYTREEKKVNGEWVPDPDGDGLWDATITLQAVGGTLPIYITNFDGTVYNAHEEMGGTLSESGIYSPVNVGTGDTHAPKILPTVRVASTNPDNIEILVTSPDKVERGADKVTTMILPSPSGRQSFGENLAPQKICMPVDVRWTKEYQQIEWAYPHFAEWVQNQNGEAGFGNESDWTRTDVDETKLYK